MQLNRPLRCRRRETEKPVARGRCSFCCSARVSLCWKQRKRPPHDLWPLINKPFSDVLFNVCLFIIASFTVRILNGPPNGTNAALQHFAIYLHRRCFVCACVCECVNSMSFVLCTFSPTFTFSCMQILQICNWHSLQSAALFSFYQPMPWHMINAMYAYWKGIITGELAVGKHRIMLLLW